MPAYKDGKTNKWYAAFYYRDWTGERIKKCKRGFETKKEASDWENSFKAELASSLDMTFGEFWEVYKRDVKPKLKLNTWMTKERIVEVKLMPYFKNLKMNEILPRDILQWQNKMRKARDENGNFYKPTYLKTVQTQLSCIFNHAVKYYDLRNNPVSKAGPLGSREAGEMKFWTKEEYLRFIECVGNKSYSYIAFEILYWCGIRVGELLALTPNDFDFEEHTLSITKSYQKLNGEEIITPPKTKKSVRTIIMPEMLSNEVESFLKTIYGLKKNDRIFIFSKRYLHHEMQRGAELAGVKRIRIHDIRHSHVSLLIDMGFSAVAIGNRVGHESEKITFRYAHMFPSVQTEMANKLDGEWKDGFNV